MNNHIMNNNGTNSQQHSVHPQNSIQQSNAENSEQHQQQQQQQQQQHVANLIQYAQSSYTSRPTDALSALMEALTLHNGASAAQHAMDRIRNELGDAVADCIAVNVSQRNNGPQFSNNHHANFGGSRTLSQQEEQVMAQRAMDIVQELLNDTSTFLYAQGKQHILQQAMEDGSSVVCTKCGDMIKAERWMQHAEYWCRSLENEGEG